MGVANNAIVLMDVHKHQQGHKYKLHGLLLCSQPLVLFILWEIFTYNKVVKRDGHKHTTWIKTIITLPGIR